MAKTIKSKQTYTIEVIHYTDGTSTMKRRNVGFSVVELFGLLSVVKAHLIKVFDGAFKQPTNTDLKSSGSPLIHKPNN